MFPESHVVYGYLVPNNNDKNGGGGGGGDDDMSVSDDGNGKEKLAVRIFWASSWTIDRSNTGRRGIWINSDYAC